MCMYIVIVYVYVINMYWKRLKWTKTTWPNLIRSGEVLCAAHTATLSPVSESTKGGFSKMGKVATLFRTTDSQVLIVINCLESDWIVILKWKYTSLLESTRTCVAFQVSCVSYTKGITWWRDKRSVSLKINPSEQTKVCGVNVANKSQQVSHTWNL